MGHIIDKNTVPKPKRLMEELLELAADDKEHTVKEARRSIAEKLNLSEEAQRILTSTGLHTLYYSNLCSAKSRLVKAGYLEITGYGLFEITPKGKKLVGKANVLPIKDIQDSKSDMSPEESMADSYDELNKMLAEELLSKIKDKSFEFFEQLVIDLLMKMGYGVKGIVTQPRKDGGIDGIIEEDPLGFGRIYTQAKRWTDSTVSTREMGQFIGALTERNAHRGVLVTTSKISKQAREDAKKSGKSIVLIDGEKLVEYMIEYGLGVTTYKTYKLQTIDEDYFNN